MKTVFSVIVMVMLSTFVFGYGNEDTEAVKKASMNYVEGFYEGDESKLRAGISPDLNKHGFWKKKGTDKYGPAGDFPFEKALNYAKNVREKKEFAKPGSPKVVEVIEISDKIAITKVVANWGVDYMLLAKNDGKWMIRQVLWEGPDRTANPTDADRNGAMKAGLNYVEGFYEGDADKLKNALKPTMFKFGYGFNKKEGKYYDGGQMKFEQAIAYANRVKETKKFPKADAPKKVEVLDVMNHIAAIKVTAWWGIDYMLLSRNGDKWMIEQVLWSGIPSS